jgi:hypothetical protein
MGGERKMSEYKRLTQWTENGASLDLGDPKSDMEARQALMVQFKKACNKLAELEDKLEEGTLVELPCKVGDIVYRVRAYHRKKYEIIERICFSITYRGNNKWEIFSTTDDILGVSVFLTREAAEARLKELEEK